MKVLLVSLMVILFLNNLEGQTMTILMKNGKKIDYSVNEIEKITYSTTITGNRNDQNIFTDPRDGQTYRTVQIGNQIWMAENLKATKFNDGEAIPHGTTKLYWSSCSNSAYCWYNNDEGTYKDTYGALYNWFTVNTGKLCPDGWHVPSLNEWNALGTFLGGNPVAGGKLKESGYSHWASPNKNATNASKFTGLPGSSRDYSGQWAGSIGTHGEWWSGTSVDASHANNLSLSNDSEVLRNSNREKKEGLAVRCIKGN
jgi:uncharacterized protein (TIGR02145 family)